MELFSLEDEDTTGLFITQESKNLVHEECDKSEDEFESLLGLDVNDFTSPCVSLVPKKAYVPEYSDISEDEGAFEKGNEG